MVVSVRRIGWYNQIMENFKNTAIDSESNIAKNEVIPELKEIQNKNKDVTLNNIKEEISQKEKIINNTLGGINNIRAELGLDVSNEIPPSIKFTQDSIIKLNTEKSGLEQEIFYLVEPLPEETPEEYISRSMTNIVDEYIDKDDALKSVPRLLNGAYYGRHANQSMAEFFSVEKNPKETRKKLSELDGRCDIKFSEVKNSGTFDKLKEKIWSSNRDFAGGGDYDKSEYYSNTNQVRDFFSHGRKHDAYSYSAMMFGLPEDFINTEEGKDYIHSLIDDKTIFLFGGGDSIKDLLTSEELKPKKVINFDPFVKSETIDKNPNKIYESIMLSASDKGIREQVENNTLPKADEVWATYSVPFYSESSGDVSELITNMSQVLNEGGNARISPIAVQSTEKEGENFETRKEALINSVKNLLDNPDYNVSIFNDTLKIHRIKKETK